MTLHIGIAACSAEGAALCYRSICINGAKILGPYTHPEISIHTPSLANYTSCLDRGDLEGVALLMLESANKLKKTGADFLICPDNTIHQAMPLVLPHSPLPWLHIADIVAEEAARKGFRRLGLTGTRWLVESNVYPESLATLGLECIRPDLEQRHEMNRIIMDELVNGISDPDSISCFQSIIQGLKEAACDAVILGCTEIPLIIDDTNSPLPTLDTTRLLASAAVDKAIQGNTAAC